nr:hypothetical protein [Mycolicibacterium vanbaalenii]
MIVEDAAVTGDENAVVVVDLTFAALATRLHHRLVQRGHPPHVERAQFAATGVELDPSARSDHARFGHRRPPFTFRDEPVVLQRQQCGERVAVVDLRDADLVERGVGHLERIGTRLRGAADEAEVVVADSRSARMRLRPTQHPHRWLPQRAGTLERRDDDGHAAVAHQAAVVEVERLGDVAAVVVLLQGQRRPAELRDGVELRPGPLRHRDMAELIGSGAVLLHVPAGRQRIHGGGRHDAVGCGDAVESPRQRPATTRVGRRGPRLLLQRRVGPHDRDRARHPRLHGHRGVLHHLGRGGAEPLHLGEQLQVDQPQRVLQVDTDARLDSAGDDQAVDVGHLDACVSGGEPNGLGRELPGGPAVHLALLGDTEAGDGRRWIAHSSCAPCSDGTRLCGRSSRPVNDRTAHRYVRGWETCPPGSMSQPEIHWCRDS